MNAPPSATTLQLLGTGAFGTVVGWYFYYVNRYRTDGIKLADLATVIGVIGGGAVLALFPAGTDLFGAYGLGLATGFFLYFVLLVIMVRQSKTFGVDWFLDGRRKVLTSDETNEGSQPTARPMAAAEHGPPK